MSVNEGQVALVTGASYGLGAMTADYLARDGFDVAVTDLNVDDLADTVAMVEKRGRKAFATQLDVRSVDDIDAAIDATVQGMGKIDVLINNAGVPLSKPALDVEPDEFDNVQNINVRGCYFMCQRFARHLVGTDRKGSIVNLASTFAVIGVPGVSVYGISKAAVAGITAILPPTGPNTVFASTPWVRARPRRKSARRTLPPIRRCGNGTSAVFPWGGSGNRKTPPRLWRFSRARNPNTSTVICCWLMAR